MGLITYKILSRLVRDAVSNRKEFRCSNAIDVLVYNFINANNAREEHPELLQKGNGMWEVSKYHRRYKASELLKFVDGNLNFFDMVEVAINVCEDPKLVYTTYRHYSEDFVKTLKGIGNWNEGLRSNFAEWLDGVKKQLASISKQQQDIDTHKTELARLKKKLSDVKFEIENWEGFYESNGYQKIEDDDHYNDLKADINKIQQEILDVNHWLSTNSPKTLDFTVPIYIYRGDRIQSPLIISKLCVDDYEMGDGYVKLKHLPFLTLVHGKKCDDCGIYDSEHFNRASYAVNPEEMRAYMDIVLFAELTLPMTKYKGVKYLNVNDCSEAAKFGIESKRITKEQVIFLYCHVNEMRKRENETLNENKHKTFVVGREAKKVLDSIPSSQYDSYLRDALDAYHECSMIYESVMQKSNVTLDSVHRKFVGTIKKGFSNSKTNTSTINDEKRKKAERVENALKNYVNSNTDKLVYECHIANTLLAVVKEFNSMLNTPLEFVLRFNPRLSNKTFLSHQFFFDDGEEQEGKSITHNIEYFYVTGRATCDYAIASNQYNVFKNYNAQFYGNELLFNKVDGNPDRPQRLDIIKRRNVFSVGFVEEHGKDRESRRYGLGNVTDPDNVTDDFIERVDKLGDLPASIPNIVMMWKYANKEVIKGVDLNLKAFAESEFYEDWHTLTSKLTGVDRSIIKLATMKGVFNSQKNEKDFEEYIKSIIPNQMKKVNGKLTFDKTDGLRGDWEWALVRMVERGLLDKNYRIIDLDKFLDADLRVYTALGKWMKDQIRGLRVTRQMYSSPDLGYGKPFLIEGIVVIKSVIDTIRKFKFVESCGMKYDAVSFTYNKPVSTAQIIDVLTYWQKRCKEYLRKVVWNISRNKEIIIPKLK